MGAKNAKLPSMHKPPDSANLFKERTLNLPIERPGTFEGLKTTRDMTRENKENYTVESVPLPQKAHMSHRLFKFSTKNFAPESCSDLPKPSRSYPKNIQLHEVKRETYGQLAVPAKCKCVIVANTHIPNKEEVKIEPVSCTNPKNYPPVKRSNSGFFSPEALGKGNNNWFIRLSGVKKTKKPTLRSQNTVKSLFLTSPRNESQQIPAAKAQAILIQEPRLTEKDRKVTIQPLKTSENSVSAKIRQKYETDSMYRKKLKKLKRMRQQLAVMRDTETRSMAEKKRVWVGENGRFSKKRLEEWYMRMDEKKLFA